MSRRRNNSTTSCVTLQYRTAGDAVHVNVAKPVRVPIQRPRRIVVLIVRSRTSVWLFFVPRRFSFSRSRRASRAAVSPFRRFPAEILPLARTSTFMCLYHSLYLSPPLAGENMCTAIWCIGFVRCIGCVGRRASHWRSRRNLGAIRETSGRPDCPTANSYRRQCACMIYGLPPAPGSRACTCTTMPTADDGVRFHFFSILFPVHGVHLRLHKYKMMYTPVHVCTAMWATSTTRRARP